MLAALVAQHASELASLQQHWEAQLASTATEAEAGAALRVQLARHQDASTAAWAQERATLLASAATERARANAAARAAESLDVQVQQGTEQLLQA